MESGHASEYPPEQALASFWAGGRVPPSLRDLSGKPVAVIYPGRWSAGYGPDFQGALVQIGAAPPARGDVEIHVRASDWQRHGHDSNPAYGKVLLHVVWHADALLPGPVVELRRYLSPSDVVKYRAVGLKWDSPCGALSSAVPAHPAALIDLIESAGEKRFTDRSIALSGDAEVLGWDQALYRAMMQSVGYSRNATPFQQLADALPLEVLLHSPASPAELLVAASGLDPRAATAALIPRERWNLARTRPLSHPVRRLQGLGGVIEAGRRAGGSLSEQLFAIVRSADAGEVIGRLTVKASSGPALIGRERAITVAVNAVLPIAAAYAAASSDGSLELAAREVWHRMPAAGKSHVDVLMSRHLGLPKSARVPSTARQQQGLLHFYKRYCRDNLCEACPAALGVIGRA